MSYNLFFLTFCERQAKSSRQPGIVRLGPLVISRAPCSTTQTGATGATACCWRTPHAELVVRSARRFRIILPQPALARRIRPARFFLQETLVIITGAGVAPPKLTPTRAAISQRAHPVAIQAASPS